MGDDEDRKQRVGLLVALVATAAAITAFVFLMMKDKGTYSKPVDVLADQRLSLVGKPIRAEGLLVHGSLMQRDTPCEFRFRMHGDVREVAVRYASCALPDGFKDSPDEELGVTVEGKLLADDSLEATQILTKCPSKYKERATRSENTRAF